jgi:hypothetical protein
LYGYGNPINLIDPTGQSPILEKTLSRFENANDNPKDVSGFTSNEMTLIDAALLRYIARAYNRSYSELGNRMYAATYCLPPWIQIHIGVKRYEPAQAFLKIHGHKITFVKFAENPDGTAYKDFPGEANDSGGINIYWGRGTITTSYGQFSWIDDADYQRFIVHEVGHVFNNLFNKDPQRLVQGIGEFMTPDVNQKNGFYDNRDNGWQRRGPELNNWDLAGDIFSDQFIGWVYKKWQDDDDPLGVALGEQRSDFMEKNMSMWIEQKLGSPLMWVP